MFEAKNVSKNKLKQYESILNDLTYLIIKTDTQTTKFANLSALLNYYMRDINWVGFYLFDGDKLTLGPFQGLPACTVINLDNGVCGQAASLRQSQIIKDVSKTPNHIVCDINTKSEIVIPIIKNSVLCGVLDIDSPKINRFNETDQDYLEQIINKFIDIL
jgi:GAF domain-containing protein